MSALRFSLVPASFFAVAAVLSGCEPAPMAASDGGVTPDGGADAWIDEGEPRAVFVVPRDGVESAFFDLPWPSDLRLTASGTPDLSTFPNPRGVVLLREYIEAIGASQAGWALNGAAYLRFSRAVDETTLPDTIAETVAEGASVFLIDVDPDSPEVGTRHPAVVDFEDRRTLFWPGHCVTVRPVHGIGLAGGRTYAAVVTTAVTQVGGAPFARDEDFVALMDGSGDAAVAAARTAYADAIDVIVGAGVAEDEILTMAVFTTQDVLRFGLAMRDHVDALAPPAAVESAWTTGSGGSGIVEIIGRYGPVPVFQEGEIPYVEVGGEVTLDASGDAVVHGTYEARVSISLPASSAVPPGGYPVVLYSHGTGGNYRSYVSDETARRLAAEGYATIGIDQIHHGARNPTDLGPEILFFNLQNPYAVRFNTLESAIDIVSQARFAANVSIPAAAAPTITGGPVHFDPDQMYFFGHSQGGLVGPLFLGVDDSVRGGVVSAGGAILAYALLEKVEPISIPGVVRSALELPGGSEAFALEGFDFDHPVITLLQGWIEPSEPANYGLMAFESPREGYAPKSILSTEGLMDEYVAPRSIEALAISMRVPLLEPEHQTNVAWDFLGLSTMGPLVTGNAAGGLATAGLLQFPDQGHFAVFDDADAMSRIAGFFRSLSADGMPGTIPAP